MSGIDRIAAERQRQMDVEGWTPEHDDLHGDGSLLSAAYCYQRVAMLLTSRLSDDEKEGALKEAPPSNWPWEPEWWKPSPDPIRNLEKAGALRKAEAERIERSVSAIAAEIDRLERAKRMGAINEKAPSMTPTDPPHET